jgi:hypothetical protein
MKKMLKGLAITALIALSMLASTSDAFAKDAKHGRETAWTLPAPDGDLLDGGPDGGLLEVLDDGVTWE